MMNEIAILSLVIECLILGVFSYLIITTNKKQQMVVNGLSHVWGQLNQINIRFMEYMIENKNENKEYLDTIVDEEETDEGNS
tara:strand:- start:15976 stop:16221 length:246 start_codon:yes stop_codon:yes gene_type:complete